MHFQRHLIARKYSLSLQRACTIISEGFNKWNVTRKKYSSLRCAEALINITLSAFPLVPRIPSRRRANFTIDRTELLHGFLANCVTFISSSPLFSTPFPSITISCYFAIYIVKRTEELCFALLILFLDCTTLSYVICIIMWFISCSLIIINSNHFSSISPRKPWIC